MADYCDILRYKLLIYMDGQCHKSWLKIVLSGLRKYLYLRNVSKKAIIKIEMKLFSWSWCSASWIFFNFTMIYPFPWKDENLKSQKTYSQIAWYKILC